MRAEGDDVCRAPGTELAFSSILTAKERPGQTRPHAGSGLGRTSQGGRWMPVTHHPGLRLWNGFLGLLRPSEPRPSHLDLPLSRRDLRLLNRLSLGWKGLGGSWGRVGLRKGKWLCACTDLISPPGGGRNTRSSRGPAKLKQRMTGNNTKMLLGKC